MALLRSLLLCSAVAMTTPSSPSAQAMKDAPSVALKQDAAAQHFQLGLKFYRSGDYAAARLEFETAYGLSPLPDLLHNLSWASEKLGQYAAAIDYEERFLAVMGAQLSTEETDLARGRLLRLHEAQRSSPAHSPQTALPARPSPPAAAAQLPPSWRPPAPAIALVASGAAALVVGIACGSAALATSAQLHSGQPFTLREIDALNTRGEALNATAITFDVLAGTALVAGGAWMLADRLRPQRADRRLAWVPPPAPTMAWATLR